MKQVPTANKAQRGTFRICDVPDEIPIGEALRTADRIALGHLDTAPPVRPVSLAWDFIKDASSEH